MGCLYLLYICVITPVIIIKSFDYSLIWYQSKHDPFRSLGARLAPRPRGASCHARPIGCCARRLPGRRRAPMAATSGSAASAVAAATKLRDEAAAAAQKLEDEATSLRSSNMERSLQLQAEADLLKSAAAAQDRVRAAADALEKERAQADLLEQQAADLRERLRPEPRRDDDHHEEDDARSFSSEAAAVTHLHSQAAAVQNIKNLIPIVLDLNSSNYSKWRGYVLLILGRFALKDHVLSDAARPDDPAWARMDCVVVSWLFNTISADLLDVVHEPDGLSARAAWLGIEQQFLNNRESRAMLLDAEFRTLTQGALSIDDFCRKMKGMADALADLGEPVPDRTLVLNVLRGLNERFQFMAQLVTRQRPFPSFTDVRADLRLAELNMTPSSAAPSALVTSAPRKTNAPTQASAPVLPRPPQAAGATGGASPPNNRGRRRRGGRGQGNSSGSGSSPAPPGSTQGSTPWPSFLNPWTGSIHMWPGSTPGGQRGPPPHVGSSPHQAMAVGAPPTFYPPAPGAYYAAPPQAPPPAWSPWNPESLANAFSTVSLTPPPNPSEWVIDSGASSHIAANPGMVTMSPTSSFPSSIVVGNGATLPVVGSGYSTLPGPFRLNNVLVAPDIIKNLLSVRQFTSDNLVSVEFDPLGVSVKDLRTRNLLLRCDSSGPLYTLQLPSSPSGSCALVATPSSTTWHRRLGHPGSSTLQHLAKTSSIVCSSTPGDPSLCHACQLGRHVRLPFSSSFSRASKNFDLIHCDLWTSPIVSVSGFKYYLVIIDDCSHFVWTFPLKLKSDTFTTLSNFFSYVLTQFGCTIKAVQCDNGREFDNSASRTFFLAKGVSLRMSCPYTSLQNGKAERMLRTANNVTRTLLFQASMPPSYWADALATATPPYQPSPH